jgi:hypothetical protein
VVNQPYVHFLDGDVQAGPGFGDTCHADTSAGIRTYTSNTGTQAVGSGSQFAALSMDEIRGFSSANLRNYLTPTASSGLSFANTTASGGGAPSPKTGGNLSPSSSYAWCLPDYFATKPDGLSTPDTATSAVTIGTQGNQYYKPSGGTLTIHGNGGVIGSSTAPFHQTIYVDGNVYIDGDIKFGGTGGWSSIQNIPSLYIIAKGNIYLSNGVKQLDGIYVAQPDDSNNRGIINTCSNGTSSYSTTDLFNNCRRQLVVNGAFVSKKLFLNRTYSSMRYSGAAENYYGTAHSCGHPGRDAEAGEPTVATDCSAEIFHFVPELYMGQPDFKSSIGPTSGTFDSVTSLSPVL